MQASAETSPLYRHLMQLKSRPAIFLGGHSLERLNANLYGWKAHRHQFADSDDWADHFFDHFHGFVAAQYGVRQKRDWHDVIAAQVGDPRAQLALFYKLLALFDAAAE